MNATDTALINQALDELPVDCREVFRLVRQQGISVDEAAQQLNLRPRQARRLLARALAHCLMAVETPRKELFDA
jgi:RNA polymerase sigma factor (sigma-70 family)